MRASSQIILLLSLILVGILGGAYVNIDKLNALEHDANAINKLGVIRGSIQLITKHELNGQESQEDIQNVDNILEEIKEGYFKQEAQHPYFTKYSISEVALSLEAKWQALKLAYEEHRQDNKAVPRVIELSDQCWDLAYDLVFQVQKFSEGKLDSYRNIIVLSSLIICLFMCLVIAIVYRIVHNVLERDVITDPLTGLYNRSHFNKVLAEQLALFNRYQTTFTLTLIDIDHFKKINDEFGHPEGDRVLCDVANLLTKNTRDADFLFRLGGEEFAIISPHASSQQTFHQAEKYRHLIESFDLKLKTSLTISVGIAQSFKGCTVEEIYKNTDIALYRAKSLGRNTTIDFDTYI